MQSDPLGQAQAEHQPADLPLKSASSCVFCRTVVQVQSSTKSAVVSDHSDSTITEVTRPEEIVNVASFDLTPQALKPSVTLSGNTYSETSFLHQNLPVISTLTTPDKSSSPRVQCQFRGTSFTALIDTGAEVNALDKDFVESLKIGITRLGCFDVTAILS